MRRLRFAMIPTLVLALCAVAQAQVQAPKVIPRMEKVNRQYGKVFGTYQHYFADLSHFTVLSTDETTGVIRARREGIDTAIWNRWAYCKVGPLQLLDTLQASTATVEVKLERAGNDATYVTVTANFQAVYGIGSQRSTVQCISNGALESDLLAVVGSGSAAN